MPLRRDRRERRVRVPRSIFQAWCRVRPEPAPEARYLDPSQWSMLANTACREGVAGLVFRAIALDPCASGVPEPVRLSLRSSALTHAALNAREESVLGEVLDAMHTRSVRPMLLRGAALIASVYDGDGSLRAQVDHDLLVREDEVTAAEDALVAAGFRPASPEGPYTRETSLVDLHTDPYGRSRIPSRSRIIRTDTGALLDRGVPMEIAGNVVLVPSAADRLLLLAVHAVKHSFDRLIRVVDVAECWRAGGFRAEDLVEQAFEEGTADFLYYALAASRRRLGAPIPVEFLRRLRPDRRRIVDRVFSRYLSGDRVTHLAEWLLLYQVRGIGRKARALWEMVWPRQEVQRIRENGPVYAAGRLPMRAARLAGRAFIPRGRDGNET